MLTTARALYDVLDDAIYALQTTAARGLLRILGGHP